MESDGSSLKREKRTALSAAALATLATLVALLLTPEEFTIRYAAALIGVWLLFASLIRYASLQRRIPMPTFRRPIPIRFGGNLGRFTLRALGDGRRVEVRAGEDVVAEAVATDEQDELILDLEAVDDTELDAFGAAIGQAIEMVAVADGYWPAEREIENRRSWGSTGGVLRTIGSRSHQHAIR